MQIAEDAVTKYKMLPEHAIAMKLCAIWAKLCYAILPDYQHYRISTKGDPRKTHLFRYCYKLYRETKNMIKDDDYEYYIRAQLEMMRSIRNADINVRIDPMILVGDKAWIRWKMWKRRYDKADKARSISGAEEVHASTYKVAQELERTRSFLVERFGSNPTLAQISEAKESGDLSHWMTLQKVSPSYILLSPFCRKACGGVQGIVDHFAPLDFAIYKGDCTKEVLQIAYRMFANEFQK